MKKRPIILFFCLVSFLGCLHSQPVDNSGTFSYNADSILVSFVNFYPGSDVYELEGHSALRIRFSHDDPGTAISYGMFDFNAPNFVYRFVKGETDYWVGAMPWNHFMYQYLAQDRKVVEHPIVMDSIAKARLVELINENLRPENAVYRYNYVLDNCATRPLNIVEKALGDSIILPQPTGEISNASTFREVMEYYHHNYPWYQFGIDLALGNGIDRPISAREKAFAPVVLDLQLPGATVAGRKLTAEPIVLHMGTDATLPPTPFFLTPLFLCWLFFALTLLVSYRDLRRMRTTKWFDAVYYGLCGLAGIVVTFLVFVSTHEATSPNWLILWLNPLCLIVPVFIWLKKCKNIVISYQCVNFALLIVMIVLLPLSGQKSNWAFTPLIASDMLRSALYVYINRKNRNVK